MTNLEKLIRYILLEYPNTNELSKPRLVKLIYLIDWKYTIEYGNQYTSINWYFNHYGPYVNDIIDLMRTQPNIFQIKSYNNKYEGITDKFLLTDKTPITLSTDVKYITDLFIDYTYKLTWSNFISLVYSSYPIKSSLKYTNLDLVKMSVEFKKNTR
jgi:hypothetical protein